MHRVELPDWAVERGRVLNAFTVLAPARTTLVNIDMQTVFLEEGQVYGNPHGRDIVANVNALSHAMRRVGGTVIWTRQTHTFDAPWASPSWQYDLTREEVRKAVDALQWGASGHALYRLMDVGSDDRVLDKYRYGALSCPAGALRRALEAGSTELAVITGTLTNCCCESTARELNMAGYKVVVVSDATAAVTDAEHNAALLNLRLNFADVKTTAEVLAMIT